MGKSNRTKRFLALTVTARKARERFVPHAKAAREGLAGLRSYRDQVTLSELHLERLARRAELPER
jgi:hypothetical protein